MKKLISIFVAGCFVIISHSAMAQGDDYIVHTIKKGEIISVLAKKYGLTVDQIIKLNKFGPNPVLHVGDRVKLPVNAVLQTQVDTVKAAEPITVKEETKVEETTIVPAANTKPVIHTIERGEVLSVLAKKYNVAVDEIVKLNKFGPRPVLHVGDKIKLPPGAHESSVAETTVPQTEQPVNPPAAQPEQPVANKEQEMQAPAGATIHVVRGKETLFAISRQYKVTVAQIKNWNHLTGDNISAGQKLIINGTANTAAASDQPVANAETQKPPKPQPQIKQSDVVVTSSPAEKLVPEKKQDPTPVAPKQAAPVVDANIPATGYFSTLFGKDVNGRNLQTANGVAMTFKTASGWTDKKYYILMNDIPPGSIVQITNADGKAVYAKVLWNMGDIKDNEGLTFRISDAAATALDLKDNKFQLAVTYYE